MTLSILSHPIEGEKRKIKMKATNIFFSIFNLQIYKNYKPVDHLFSRMTKVELSSATNHRSTTSKFTSNIFVRTRWLIFQNFYKHNYITTNNLPKISHYFNTKAPQKSRNTPKIQNIN